MISTYFGVDVFSKHQTTKVIIYRKAAYGTMNVGCGPDVLASSSGPSRGINVWWFTARFNCNLLSCRRVMRALGRFSAMLAHHKIWSGRLCAASHPDPCVRSRFLFACKVLFILCKFCHKEIVSEWPDAERVLGRALLCYIVVSMTWSVMGLWVIFFWYLSFVVLAIHFNLTVESWARCVWRSRLPNIFALWCIALSSPPLLLFELSCCFRSCEVLCDKEAMITCSRR